MAGIAWAINPNMAVRIRSRFFSSRSAIENHLRKFGERFEILASLSQEGLFLLLKDKPGPSLRVRFDDDI